MYGLIHKAIRDCVRQEFGADAWNRIEERAGADQSIFVSMQAYPDEVTLGLLASTVGELNLDLSDLLNRFGRFWVLHTARTEYGPLFDFAGSDVRSFLGNLNAMHEQVAITFANLRQPSFTVEDGPDGSILLHYESPRSGLSSFVIGLLEGLSEHFEQPLQIEHVENREEGAPHDVFRLNMAS